jgi:hypothetical protein
MNINEIYQKKINNIYKKIKDIEKQIDEKTAYIQDPEKRESAKNAMKSALKNLEEQLYKFKNEMNSLQMSSNINTILSQQFSKMTASDKPNKEIEHLNVAVNSLSHSISAFNPYSGGCHRRGHTCKRRKRRTNKKRKTAKRTLRKRKTMRRK